MYIGLIVIIIKQNTLLQFYGCVFIVRCFVVLGFSKYLLVAAIFAKQIGCDHTQNYYNRITVNQTCWPHAWAKTSGIENVSSQ